MSRAGGLDRLTILAYKDSAFTQKVGEYTVGINPSKYSHGYKICYNDVQGQGSSAGSPDFNKILSDRLSFELVFDGTGVVPPTKAAGSSPTPPDVAGQIDAFKNLVFTYNGKIHSPNFLQLSWGTLLFDCRLSSLDITYTLFQPDGTPLRARADVKFLGYNNEAEIAARARKSSPDVSHSLTLQAGDTLPLMCFRVYGSSLPYLRVARLNGLVNFRDIPIGTILLFPPIDGLPT